MKKVFVLTKITFAKDGGVVRLDTNIFESYVKAVRPLVKYIDQKGNKVSYQKGHISTIRVMDKEYLTSPKYAFTLVEKTVF